MIEAGRDLRGQERGWRGRRGEFRCCRCCSGCRRGAGGDGPAPGGSAVGGGPVRPDDPSVPLLRPRSRLRRLLVRRPRRRRLEHRFRRRRRQLEHRFAPLPLRLLLLDPCCSSDGVHGSPELPKGGGRVGARGCGGGGGPARGSGRGRRPIPPFCRRRRSRRRCIASSSSAAPAAAHCEPRDSEPLGTFEGDAYVEGESQRKRGQAKKGQAFGPREERGRESER